MFSVASRVTVCLLLCMTIGCNAQQPPATAALSPEQKSRIEMHLRARYKRIPTDVEFIYGERKASQFAGYDVLPVTLSKGERKSTLEFLISEDGKSLVPLESNPADKLLMSKDGKEFVVAEKIDISHDIEVANRPVRGNANAKVTIVNFDDFQCPFCAQMHQTLASDVPRVYGDKVKVIYKDYPLTQIHPWALHAEVNANCLNDQSADAYWSYADYVHANQQNVSKNDKGEKRPLIEQQHKLDEIAADYGKQHKLDMTKLNACIQKQDESAVRASMKEGDDLGVESTPTLFINGERIEGVMPFEAMRGVIDHALQQAGVPLPEEKAGNDKKPAADAKTQK
jgi:protein-disulfide isomerase